LVQLDGSHHHWFGLDRDKACLMNMVDDATSATLALIDEEETTAAAMKVLWRWIEEFGIPLALYTDKKNVYVTDREATLEEQLAGQAPMTAFGKSCYKLGIEIVIAHSPQAKGRVERSNGTYQDRLLKELALRRISTCATADRLLHNGFCAQLNERFAQAPLEAEDSHRPVPEGLDLDDVFCFEEYRVVQNDWCVRHENRYYQILKENTPLPKPKDKILVRTHLDGRVQLLYHDKALAFHPISPKQLQRQRSRQAPVPQDQRTESAASPSPAADHPWRRGCTLMKAETRK
jgi:hypothetical protein